MLYFFFFKIEIDHLRVFEYSWIIDIIMWLACYSWGRFHDINSLARFGMTSICGAFFIARNIISLEETNIWWCTSTNLILRIFYFKWYNLHSSGSTRFCDWLGVVRVINERMVNPMKYDGWFFYNAILNYLIIDNPLFLN